MLDEFDDKCFIRNFFFMFDFFIWFLKFFIFGLDVGNKIGLLYLDWVGWDIFLVFFL